MYFYYQLGILMKRFLLSMAFLVVAAPVFADNAPTLTADQCKNFSTVSAAIGGMTDSQIAKMKAVCDPKSDSIKIEDVKISELGDSAKNIGLAIGLAIGETAKQLNVAANDFVKSPAGMITVGIIIAKLFAGPVFKFFICILGLIIASKIYFFMISRIFSKKYVYESKPVLWGLYNKRIKLDTTYTKFDDLDGDSQAVIICGTIAYTIIAIVFLCNAV